MILLDTNILIDLDRYMFDASEMYGASVLSRAELEFGVQVAATAHETAVRTRRLNELDSRFAWLEFDLAATRSYGLVAANARAQGARIRSKDALITAQAHRYGAAVMTSNIADFRPFDHMVEIVQPRTR